MAINVSASKKNLFAAGFSLNGFARANGLKEGSFSQLMNGNWKVKDPTRSPEFTKAVEALRKHNLLVEDQAAA